MSPLSPVIPDQAESYHFQTRFSTDHHRTRTTNRKMAKKKSAKEAKPAAQRSANPSANLGFEAKLWSAADKLRNNMDAAEYKHTVLGLIFLKYISDAFTELHDKLVAGQGEYEGADPEDADEYTAENVFWVPPVARWQFLQDNAKQASIGKLVDDAMDAIG